MSEWQECKLGDVATVRGGKRLPKGKMLNALPTNHPYIRITDFSGHKILLDGIQYVDDEIQKSIARYTVTAGDLVISIVGTLGLCAIIPKELDKANLTENCANIHVIEDNVDKLYLYYHLISTETQDNIVGFDVGSTQPKLPLYNVQNINLLLPPLPEQRAIAGVLSSLDDKIDLLHRQNKTLEGMAEALWRKMFVEEADPGWKKGKLGDYITVKGGTTPSTSNAEYWDGNIFWTAPRDLSGSNAVFLHETERKITEKGLSQIGSGLLPVGTVLLSSRAPIGYIAISNIPVAINQGYIAVICDRFFSNYYMFLWIKSNMDLIIGSANGSTFLEISKSVFKSLEANVPNESDLEKFDLTTKPVFDKILVNEIQIRTLSRLRDTLLPKLMSGEVTVKL